MIYATADVLDRSNTLFETTRARAVLGERQGAADPGVVGRPRGRIADAAVSLQRLPLTGRNAELGIMRKAFCERALGGRPADRGRRRGRRRQDAVARSASRRSRQASASCTPSCEAYTASTPYALWRELLRELMDFGRDDAESWSSRVCAATLPTSARSWFRGCR